MDTVNVKVTLEISIPVPTTPEGTSAAGGEVGQLLAQIERDVLGQKPPLPNVTVNVETSVASSQPTPTPTGMRDDRMECNEAPAYDGVDEGVFALFAQEANS